MGTRREFIAGLEKVAGMTGNWNINRQAAADFSRGASQGGKMPGLGQMWQNAKNAFGSRPAAATPPGGAPPNVGLMSKG